jgi:hypothetical protein
MDIYHNTNGYDRIYQDILFGYLSLDSYPASQRDPAISFCILEYPHLSALCLGCCVCLDMRQPGRWHGRNSQSRVRVRGRPLPWARTEGPDYVKMTLGAVESLWVKQHIAGPSPFPTGQCVE